MKRTIDPLADCPDECERCGVMMMAPRPGDDPSPICDYCAQELAAPLWAKLRAKIRANLRAKLRRKLRKARA